jgi:Flp pilus assembly protein TadB
MAQAKRKRKHRGTPAGTIERRGRTSKPPESASRAKPKRQAARSQAPQTAAERRAARFDNPPTWRSALNRAAFAAAILVIFIGVVQKNWVQAIVMGVFAMAIYIPMSYYTDRMLYRRFQRKKQAAGR